MIGARRRHTSRRACGVSPGLGTAPHRENVFTNRRTPDLYTAWTPLGDIDTKLGGLITLEDSHKDEANREAYGLLDVDP